MVTSVQANSAARPAIPPSAAAAANAIGASKAPGAMSSTPPATSAMAAAGAGVAAAASDANATGTASAANTQDRFLKLLVTQMKNQDPLNPMDNAQVTSQMAQLSTVSGVDKLNGTLSALSGNMMSTQSMHAASMIGHAVLVPGSKMALVNGRAGAAVELTQPAENLAVTIEDAKGNAVRTLQMGSQKAGIAQVQWDGKTDAGSAAAAGVYNLTATAMAGTSKSTPATFSYGMVNSVAQSPQGAVLSVENVGDVNLSDVKQIL